ncbi:MAG: hypothetical protein JW902_08690, partial [Syntrophaceae bacterium]|nr:hypothetical protein [Syntrophaceae bacterium]
MFLPDFAGWWLKAYESHPGIFFPLLLAFAWCLYINSRFQIRIFDRMRRLWQPFINQPGVPVTVSAPPEYFLYRLRTNVFLKLFFKQLSRDVIPPALAGVAVLVLLVVFTRGFFSVMNAAGFICSRSVAVQSEAGVDGHGVFSCNDICWSSGLEVQKGRRYRITIRMDENYPWHNDAIETGLAGFGREKMTPAMNPGLAFRRHMTEPWFK